MVRGSGGSMTWYAPVPAESISLIRGCLEAMPVKTPSAIGERPVGLVSGVVELKTLVYAGAYRCCRGRRIGRLQAVRQPGYCSPLRCLVNRGTWVEEEEQVLEGWKIVALLIDRGTWSVHSHSVYFPSINTAFYTSFGILDACHLSVYSQLTPDSERSPL